MLIAIPASRNRQHVLRRPCNGLIICTTSTVPRTIRRNAVGNAMEIYPGKMLVKREILKNSPASPRAPINTVRRPQAIASFG
jgi:hypothetical protein